jgi:diguanylate cyclase (GGDEF)-like protein/PAS domain S-box-containing protein
MQLPTETVGKGNGHKPIENTLADSELRYRRLFEAAKDGILILDAETGEITEANPFLQEMLGYAHGELLGKTLWEIGSFRDIVASRKAFRLLQDKEYVRYDNLPLQTKTREQRHVEFVSNVYTEGNSRVIQCNIRDITERKSAEDHARKINETLVMLVDRLRGREEALCDQANHDSVTGLFNRRYLDDSLERELSLAWRRSASLSLALLDIDHFKDFNDTFGHGAGDLALRECANALSKNLRKSDIACRLGGDEFVLVMPDSSLTDTQQRIEEICALIRQAEMRYDGTLLGTMTLSVGIAVSPEHAFTARDLLRAADSALYVAKHNGRGQVVPYEL